RVVGVLRADAQAADPAVEVRRAADVRDAQGDAGGMHAGLGHHAGAGSIRTPGLSRPRGSTAAFAPRSAAANGSGRWRSYQGRWSRPTAWWWVIVPPAAITASDAAALIADHCSSSSPRAAGESTVKYGAGPSG